ncbi:MAG: FKBP-type peptidyl-prolyl cis-trans isomerase [Bacteroidales bacterium]
MKIEKDKMVSIIYELRENDPAGEVVEALDESRPLSFVFGTGRLLPSFESNLSGRSEGDSFAFSLTAEEAYGDRREEMVIDVPVSVFEKDGKIDENICRVGNNVPMMDNQGNHLNGIILSVDEQAVKMDFNHPMAGVGLYFSGKVTEVREATEDELNPAMGGCSSCGCGGDTGCSTEGSCGTGSGCSC